MTPSGDTGSTTNSSRGSWLLEIKADLRFTGPLHVGTGERLGVGGDAPLLRDSEGRVWLPGSSVRGVIRDWCEREAPLLGTSPEAIARLFGATPNSRKRDTTDRQGRLRVFDVELPRARTAVRDHVKINREYGAAGRGGKFDVETAEVSTGTLCMAYEGTGETDEEVTLLRAAAEALEQGLLGFGGKRGWGLGGVVAKVSAHVRNRSSAEDCAAYLLGRLADHASQSTKRPDALSLKPADYAKAIPRSRREDEPSAQSWLSFELDLQFDGPMLVGGTYRPSSDAGSFEREADATYVALLDGEPILPGSSLRGALHSHADRVIRSLQTLGYLKTDPSNVLFGTTDRRGLLSVAESRLVGDPRPLLLNHVALDRITGFAADTKLFSAAALASPRFRASLLATWNSDEEEQQAAIGLLLLLLRDAEQGRIWIGSRTTRGYGWLKEVDVRAIAGSRVIDNRRLPFSIERRPLRKLDECDEIQPLLAAWRRVAGLNVALA
jgi:CRISPR/Cas system CSM-associated protein Csm3 (group 7 of RAMP superfamily)